MLSEELTRVFIRAPWMSEAACRHVDPELFFPGRGDSPTIAAAKQVCRGCPVIDACLAYAVESGEQGIWGGKSAKERRLLRRDHLGLRVVA